MEQNSVRYFVNPSLDHLELFTGSFTTQKFKPHFHACYTIILLNQGMSDYSSDKNNYLVSTGAVLVLNPYEVHTGQSINGFPWHFMTLYVPVNIMEEAMQKAYGILDQPLFSNNTIYDSDLFLKGKGSFPAFTGREKSEHAEALLMQFLETLIKKHGFLNKSKNSIDQNCRRTKMIQLRNFIHANYHQPLSLEQLGELSGFSSYGLIKAFKYYFHISPHQYVLNLRIERAKQLLKEQYPATEVTYLIGFFDQSHFNRHFKRIVGITPKQYQQRFFSKV